MPVTFPGLVSSGQVISASFMNSLRNAGIAAYSEQYAWTTDVVANGKNISGVGTISAVFVTASSNVSAASATITGAISGASLSVTGSVSAVTVTASGGVTATGAVTGATLAISGNAGIGGASPGGRLGVNVGNDTGNGIRINGASSASYMFLDGIHGGGVNGYGRIGFWTGAALGPLRFEGALQLVSAPANAANDAAAAGLGVPIGQVYRNGSVLMLRVS